MPGPMTPAWAADMWRRSSSARPHAHNPEGLRPGLSAWLAQPREGLPRSLAGASIAGMACVSPAALRTRLTYLGVQAVAVASRRDNTK